MKITPLIAGQEIPAVHNIRVPLGAFTGQARGFGALGAGLAEMSEDWYHIARYEQAIEERKKQFDRVTKTLELSSELKGRVDDLHREIERFPSADNNKILKHFDRQRNLISGEMRSKALLSGSDVYDLFNRESVPIWTAAEIKAKEIRDLKWRDEKVANLDTIQNRLEKDAAEALAGGKDPGPAIEFYDALMRQARDEGIISSVQLEKRRETLSDRINANLKALQAEMQRQEEKAVETRVYSLLKAEFGTDFDKILDRLDDPGFLNRQGLTVEKAANLKNIVKNEQARFDQETKALQDQTEGDLWIRYQNNQLTYRDIEYAWEKKALRKEAVHALGDALRVRLEKKTRETDLAIFDRLLDLVYDPNVSREKKRYAVMQAAGSLSETDAERLMLKIQEVTGSVDDRYRKQAYDVFKSQIIPKRGIMAPFTATPQEELTYHNAVSGFDKLLEDLRAAGKPLRGKEILDKAIEVAPGYRKGMFERIEDVSKAFKEEAERARAPKAGAPMTDSQIKKLLEDNGYEGTPENIRKFKAKNGIK